MGYREDFREILKAADIFLMPSYREGLPTVVMEAMSAGLPVIGTDIRGNRDLIQPGKTGYLVGVDDAGQMAQAIKRLAEDENLRREMGAGGQTAILPFGRGTGRKGNEEDLLLSGRTDMERQVRVSVIMGVYNGEKTLNAAIQSIVDQTMTDWELIICNDCSTDRTGEVLREWMRREPRIRCLENASNMRLAASLNRCIEAAEGKYIARMDDDDISYPERLWLEADFLDRHPEYGFVSGQIDGFDGKRLIPDYWHRKEKPEKKDFLSGSQFVHPAVMFRRECLEEMGRIPDRKEHEADGGLRPFHAALRFWL